MHVTKSSLSKKDDTDRYGFKLVDNNNNFWFSTEKLKNFVFFRFFPKKSSKPFGLQKMVILRLHYFNSTLEWHVHLNGWEN